jgi:hypothetical protein
MKVTQILYLVIFVGIIVYIVTSTRLSDSEGFKDAGLPVNSVSEPTIPKGVEPKRLSIQAMPNASQPGTLPFGPYGQQASVGSYQYQDPAQLPATLKQIRRLYEDLKGFLVFEGVSIANSSDPSVQLPLTQLRADSQRLEEEIAVLKKNSGIQSSLTQQNLADIRGALTFLQRKVRLFQTAGVISTTEGFESGSGGDDSESDLTRATQEDLEELQAKVYAAILTLSSSGSTDLVVQARIKNLQNMYSGLEGMVQKLNKGIWTEDDIPLYKADVSSLMPKLDDPSADISIQFSTDSGNTMPEAGNSLEGLVGNVINSIKDNGMIHVNMELGYNGSGYGLGKAQAKAQANAEDQDMTTASPFDSTVSGAEQNNSKVGGLNWKGRAESICEQVRLRGLDPLDFGCLAKGATMSPAYSWRGHTKMVCGRLGSTMEPNLPIMSGCPPQEWPGWNAF